MSDNNLDNWEKELQESLSDHQEATGPEDLKAFMNKLEQRHFFESEKPKFSGKWLVLVGFFVASASAYWFSREAPKEVVLDGIINVAAPKNEQKIVRQGFKQSKVETPPVIEAPVTVLISTSESTQQEPANQKKVASAFVEEFSEETTNTERTQLEPKDTIGQSKTQLTQPTKAPKRAIIIMATDTTVVRDTSHRKHRKRDKKKRR